jgi:hypothetical protein
MLNFLSLLVKISGKLSNTFIDECSDCAMHATRNTYVVTSHVTVYSLQREDGSRAEDSSKCT